MTRNIDELIGQLTLEEKAGLCSGASFWTTKAIERLGIPSILMTDGPHGLRKQDGEADHMGVNESIPSTCFPSAVGMASSWNRELVRKVGEALGKESQAEGVSILLGPGANIKRSPLCGRNFEYFSEDPYLTGELAAEHIAGVQSQGVGTSIKHFAANNQEHRRTTANSIIDERTLREIYLTGFEIAVKKSQPWTVMSAYNLLNGTYCSENETLLTRILKEEWGHEGIVLSDWGAVNDAAASVAAGLELEMPSSQGVGQQRIISALESGKLSEEALNRAVERLLRIIFKAEDNRKSDATFDKDVHHELSREVARESMVLLKNEDNFLPLQKSGKLAVIGAMAEQVRYQGGGSSHINPTKVDNILDEMKAAGEKAEIRFAKGYHLDRDDDDNTLVEEAKSIASDADVAVLFVGLPDRYESEGYDRKNLDMPANQIYLIEQIASVQPNVVVVLSNGSPIVMPWLPKVKSVMEAYLGGQAAGGAIADILFGIANPSGKLAETFPMSVKQNPSHPFFPGEGQKVEYREGLFVGYRYYEAKDITPLFPFGHGLSYTTFMYSDLKLDQSQITDQETLQAHVKVKNTGERTGQEIVQIYVRAVSSDVIRPEKELKGFVKVSLEPGEEKVVSVTLDKRSFAYYNVELKDWHVETGDYEVLVGTSSSDIQLRGTVSVQSTVQLIPTFHRNSTIGEIMTNPKALPVMESMQLMGRERPATTDATNTEMMEAIIRDMPLRSLLSLARGKMTEETLTTFINRLNEAVRS